MAIMSKVNKKGKYTQYNAEKRDDTMYSNVDQNNDSLSNLNEFLTPD